MNSCTVLAVILSTGSLLSVSAQESSRIPIAYPTGAAAVTAAGAVPTFSTNLDSGAVTDAAALGNSNVVNQCNFNIYLYSCDQQGCGAETTVSPGATWSNQLSSQVNDGVSIKIGTTSGEVQKPILQFEYTNGGSLIHFDASEVNGNPFGAYGYSIGDSSGLHEYCAPPGTSCSFPYYSGEDGDVFTAPATDDISMTLCASG